MKKLSYILVLLITSVIVLNCNTTKHPANKKNITEQTENLKVSDTVKIANEELEYEIIIIDPGYATWLASMARPEGFYSQQYMENRNRIFVIEWNQRVLQPNIYNSNLYELQIDYNPQIDYGYEVNYKLYNYFIYFQLKYNQKLGPFNVRI
ncbi:hypothetical protein FUA26_07635 [Seonamhaeicola algicola]|uniref:Lipoprotein n=1 Tax=Seonamhaeicola algicola TaxID=1719036 RepID=A0A5C7AUC2_9FLAO|nr:DUF6146 family protein [Seonamhaeicola algicola]TXE11927.1 hypothetical protein FUA26_07635 [Seonamhaeicola algicola]